MTVGTPHKRVEGALKVTGAAKFAADHYPEGVLFGAIVGAPVAAGRVTAVETRDARATPGVVRVLLAADMPKFGAIAAPGAILKLPMQGDWIEWEGQPVAIVLAESVEAAEEAAALVTFSCDSTPPLVPGKGPLEAPPTTIFPASEQKGDVAAGLTAAAVTHEASYFQPTRNHNPMETSATVAQWDGDQLTLWDSTQGNINPPQVLGAAFGLPPENIRVISPHTGGGYGCKGWVWPHEILAAAAARVAGRPVRLQLTRSGQYSQVGHQAECRQTVTLGASRDGALTAIRHRSINTTSISDMQAELAGMSSRTYYAAPAIGIDHQVERVNLVLPTAMRAPLDGPGSWALESAMDELAIRLGVDPLDLRLANFAEVDPFDGKPWSSNKLREAYAEAAEVYGWRTRAQRPREDGDWLIGHGMAMASTFCNRLPSKARVRVARDGGVVVEASSNDIGTGNQTVFALVAADALGTTTDRLTIRWGDTRLPAAGPVYGSSQTMGAGGAVQAAALDARRKLAPYGAAAEGPLDLAALMARANVEEIVGEGAFAFGDQPMSFNGAGTPYAMQTWGATFVELGVDRDLGVVRLRRVVARYSAGRIINPMAARSQMIGSIVWEWGKATMEVSAVEPTHGRFLSKNLSGVSVPVNADIPSAIDVGFVDEFDPHASPIGARGIGELGATGVAAAIANAVFDATGIRVRDLPITPDKLLIA